METPTKLRSVLWQKIVEEVDEMTLGEIGKIVTRPLIILFLGYCILTNGAGFDYLIQWNNYAIPSIGIIIAIMYWTPFIYRLVMESIDNITHKNQEEPQVGDRLEGVLVDDLVHHLLTEKSFRRADIETKFKIPRHRVDILCERLEDVGILERGRNNARILAPVSQEFIYETLSDKVIAENIEKEINIVYPPEPIFTKRPVPSS